MTPRFGIFLSAQHPPELAARQIVRDCCEQVRLARELGFDDVGAGRRFLTWPYQMLQLVPLLSRIAVEAGEMRVCAGILLLTLLNPVEVAENAGRSMPSPMAASCSGSGSATGRRRTTRSDFRSSACACSSRSSRSCERCSRARS